MSYHPYDTRMAYDPDRKLTDGDIHEQKPEGWWGDEGKLYRDFAFDTYQAGVEFTVRVARLAEEQGHHPDILLRYRRVRLSYFTHDAGGVTGHDIEGARGANAIWEELSGAGVNGP